MNTIYPISSVNFLGAGKTVSRKAAKTTNYLCRCGHEEALYKQTPKMQKLVNQIYSYFEKKGKNAEDAIQTLRKRFPYFSIQLNKDPMIHNEEFALRTNREKLYDIKKGKLTPIKDIDTYTIQTKCKLNPMNFMFTVTTPESGLDMYSVPSFFKKANLDGTLKTQTQRRVEDALQKVVNSFKK